MRTIAHEDDLQHMTAKVKKCFRKLEAMGVPVKVWYQTERGYEDYRGYFWIDAECGGSEKWLDYYGNYEGNEKMNKILDDAGLYFEWYNSAFACVYDA